jgi:hypothetical protein
MMNIVLKRIILSSIAAVTVCAASTFTAHAAVDVTVSDAPAAEAAVPASDFSETSVSPDVVVSSPFVVMPEPGTLLAGLGILTYLLLKPGRRSRS